MANKRITLSDGTNNLFVSTFSATLTSNDSLDDTSLIGHDGCYWCNNVQDRPGSNTYGWLLTFNNGTIQVYIEFGSGVAHMYIRVYTNSQWYSWRQFTFAS